MRHEFGTASASSFESAFLRRQVHGARCVEITHRGQDAGEADGFWTRVPGLPVHVMTADCVPILLERLDGAAVAALHAGWRGTVARIAESFFASLPPELARPEEWRAVLGPSIRHECYEVSAELIEQFVAGFPGLAREAIEPSPRHLDLIAVNRHQLERLGVESVEIHPDCTFCRRAGEGYRYCSYRRGDRMSRQFSWVQR